MKISIIIPTHNRYSKLLKLLDSIESFFPSKAADYEIIIIDDGSTDDTARLDKLFKDTNTKVFHTSNQGPSKARNFGAKIARGELLAFLDDDCIISEAYARILFSYSLELRYDIVGGPAYSLPGNVGVITKHLDAIGYLQQPYFDSNGGFSCFASVNFVIKKEAFVSIGGFSHSFSRPGGEDNNITIRAARAGFLMKFDQEMSVFHDNHISFQVLCKRWFNYGRGMALNQQLLRLSAHDAGFWSSSPLDLLFKAHRRLIWFKKKLKPYFPEHRSELVLHTLLSYIRVSMYELGGQYARYFEIN